MGGAVSCYVATRCVGPRRLPSPPFNKVHNKMEGEIEQINISGREQLKQGAQKRPKSRSIILACDSSHVRRGAMLIGSAIAISTTCVTFQNSTYLVIRMILTINIEQIP
jgi:hypothetical protein